MKILAIETSCDETAVALLDISGVLNKPEIKILGNTLFSQAKLHEQYGGVYPNLAKREHQKNLPHILEETLRQAGYKLTNDIDYIAVTAGPGLEPALWAGITFAEELGKKWGKPVIPVDHMEGHVYSVLYKSNPDTKPELEMPALALLVSGGHTELVHVKDFRNYEIIGRTLDDAVGEAYDKVARMLGLSYPGGPKISMLAEASRAKNKDVEIVFPRPMIHSKDLNFSYSGLKTAVLYKIKSLGEINDETREDIARAFEDAAIEVLIKKTGQALLNLGDGIRSLIAAGGVSQNTRLRTELNKLIGNFPAINLCLPEKSLTTDNAVMIGIAAFIRVEKDPSLLNSNKSIRAQGNLSIASS